MSALFPGEGVIPDLDTNATWSRPEYHGDFRSAMQRRQAAIDAQEEKYRRGQAWRDGKLDQYDARHHPERLAERRVSDALAALGVTATEVKEEVT